MLLPALAVADPVTTALGANPQWLQTLSSFKHVLNLRTEDGHLVSLLSQGVEDGPFSIRLPVHCFSLTDTRFYSDGTLLVGHWLRVQWGDAPRWNPLLPPMTLRVSQPSVQAVAGCLAGSESALVQGFFSRFPALAPCLPAAHDAWVRGGTARVARLHEALTSASSEPLIEAARPLLGWGTGLTPAGDDCLLGVLAGQQMLGQRAPALRAMIRAEAATRTTTLSAALLHAASAGHFAAPWHRLSAALQRQSAANVEAAAQTLMAQGATSGADALVGWLLALLPHFPPPP